MFIYDWYFAVCPCKAVLVMMVIVIRCSAAPVTEAGDRMTRLGYGYPTVQQFGGVGGSSNFYGNNNNGMYYNQGAISPFPLFMDSSCKK